MLGILSPSPTAGSVEGVHALAGCVESSNTEVVRMSGKKLNCCMMATPLD
jgi:hypothetical protein